MTPGVSLLLTGSASRLTRPASRRSDSCPRLLAWRLARPARHGFCTLASLALVFSLALPHWAQAQNNAATGVPSISGTAQVRVALTASAGDIADADGLANVSYTWQWISNDGMTDSDIAGATAASYTPVAADVGKTLKVRASFSDDLGNEETLESAATAPVIANVPAAPTDLTATANGQTQIDLSWTAPTDTGGAAISGYKIEYSAPDYFSLTMRWGVLVANTRSTSTSYTHNHDLAPATRLQYRVSAITAVGASDPSDVAETTTPAAPDLAGNGAPNRTGITVRGTQLVITFDEDLDATSVPTKTFFLITISGIAGHHRPESVVVTGATVVLTLQAAHAVDASDMMLRVRYNAPKEEIGDAEVPITTNALKDLDGNLVKKWNPEFADYTPGTSSPSVPRGVYTESGNAQLTLHWSPVDDGGADIEKFQYQQITTGSFGATWTDIPDSGKPDPDTPGSGANFQSYTIGSGVANGTTYRYRLRAVNAAGAGPPSAEFTGRPVAAAASNTVTATQEPPTVNGWDGESPLDVSRKFLTYFENSVKRCAGSPRRT